jgi:competence protein ComEC
MTSGKSPLILPAFFWITGLITGSHFNLPVYLLIFLTGLGITITFFLKNRLIVLFLLIILSGMLRYDLTQVKPQDHITRLLELREEITQPITGTICSEVLIEKEKAYFQLELSSIAQLPVKGKIRFSASDLELSYGDEIVTIATISKLKSSSNPFAFNYEEYLNYQGIYGRGFSRIPVKVTGRKIAVFKAFSIKLRKFLRDRIEQRCPDNAGFLKAIIIGEKSDLDEIRETLTKAGLSHILAVSGLHVALISVIIFTLLRIIIRQRILLRILTIILLIMYGAVCSWSPSVSRAVIMISLYFLGQIMQRKVNANNCLFASLIIITAISPAQISSVGLHLSFCAVIVLLNIIPYFTRHIYRIHLPQNKLRKVVYAALTLIIVSFLLSIFLAPVTLYNFNQFNLNGFIGNLLGIPLISIILPLSILVILLPPVPFLIEIYQSGLDSILLSFHWWSKLAARLPFHFNFIPFSVAEVITLYLMLFFAFWLLYSYRKFKVGILAVLIISNGYFWISKDCHNLKVIFFNCGLGDLCYIETPENENIMIDCGPTDKDPDTFKRSALQYFQHSGIRKLDWLVITHAHNDHYGGVDDVISSLKIKNLLVTDEFQTREIWPQLQEKFVRENSRIFTIKDTVSLPLGNVNFKILHPDENYYDDNINNMSIVAKLEYGDLSILFNGDLEEEGEHYLISKYAHKLDCDIIKVGHHGSKTSSSQEFIDLVTPQYAVISTSIKNRFDFPHPQTLQKYSELGDKLIITGRDGAFMVESDGKNTQFRTYGQSKD